MEAEWEYAARYDDGRTYPTGEAIPEPGVAGNFAGVIGTPSAVGAYAQGITNLGLDDMIGNVWEWCYDWKDFYDEGSFTDPSGPYTVTDFRVVRGGSWIFNHRYARCAFRYGDDPADFGYFVGFRVVVSLAVSES